MQTINADRDKQVIARLNSSLQVPSLIQDSEWAWREVRTSFHSGVMILWAPSHYSDGRAIDILEVITPRASRGVGLAKLALADFLSACDRCGTEVFSQVLPADPAMAPRMVAWFAREGFTILHPDDGSGTFMHRDCRLPR
jgi:hypothetical protein